MENQKSDNARLFRKRTNQNRYYKMMRYQKLLSKMLTK